MGLFSVFLIMAVGVYWFYRFLNKPTPSTKREDSGISDDDDIAESFMKEAARIEAYIQAGIVGDRKTIDAIKADNYDGPLPEKRSDGGWLSIYDNLRILKIAGINHRRGIAMYKGRIISILVPEPDNEFDPDAIMILCKEDRHHLGYIPSDMTDFVRSMAKDTFPMECISMITEEEDDYDGHRFFMGFVYIQSRV